MEVGWGHFLAGEPFCQLKRRKQPLFCKTHPKINLLLNCDLKSWVSYKI